MPRARDELNDSALTGIAAAFGLDPRDRLDRWRQQRVVDGPLIEMVRSADMTNSAAPTETPGPRISDRHRPGGATRGPGPVPSWTLASSESVATRVERALETVGRLAHVHAFTSVWADEARAAAEALDARARRGEQMGPLFGAVIGVKDIIDVRGHAVSAGTRAFESAIAADDATVIGRLRAADAVLIGLTNLHALAYGPFSSSTDLGPVLNPLQLDAVAGGSSGGSAAAVAMGAVDLAIGTDTAGSIRMPAALCGVVGLKGTFAAAPLGGVHPLAPSLDHVGPMARTILDTAIAWEVMTDGPLDVSLLERESLEGVVVGDLRTYVRDYLDDAVRQALESALEAAARLGARVEPVTLPDLDRAPGAMLCTIGPEALDIHRELLAHRAELLPEDVRLRLEASAFIPAADYVRAQRLRTRLRAQLTTTLATVDVVLLPSLPIIAPLLDALDAPVNGGRWSTRGSMSRFTVLANLTGHPAITIPWSRDSMGAGIGIQLIGSAQHEADLLGIAGAMEREQATCQAH